MTLISTLKGPSEVVVKFLNDKFKEWQPAEIVIFTAGASLVTAYIYSELTYKVLLGANETFLGDFQTLCFLSKGAMDTTIEKTRFPSGQEVTHGCQAN